MVYVVIAFAKAEKEIRYSSLILEEKPNFPGEADKILEKNHLIWREMWNVYFSLAFSQPQKKTKKKAEGSRTCWINISHDAGAIQ